MKKISTLLLLVIFVMTIVLFAAQTTYSMITSVNMLTKEVEKGLEGKTGQEAEYINSKLASLGKVSATYADAVAAVPGYDSDILFPLTEKSILSDSLIVGGGFWLEPDEFSKGKKYYGPYMYRDGNEIKLTWDYSNEESDYFQYDWYKSGFTSDKSAIWSEPYADAVTGVAMITVTSPISKSGKKVGVTTLDVGLAELDSYVGAINVGAGSYAFMVTGQGFYLAHKDKKNNLQKKITEDEDENLRELGKLVLSAKEPGVRQLRLNGNDSYAAFSPVGETGLYLVLVLPVDDVMAGSRASAAANLIGFAVALAIFGTLLWLLINRIISKPLALLKADAECMARGDLIFTNSLAKLSKRKDEIGQLSKAFSTMSENILKLILDIKEGAQAVASNSQQFLDAASGVESASEQIAVTVSELAKGISEQAETTQNGNTAVSGIIQSLEKISGHMAKSEDMCAGTLKLVNSSMEMVKYQMVKMEESKKAAVHVSSAVNMLNDKSGQISDIVEAIVGIADQTNLLALNAAIEAARAGEHGKGFAVVADEVRKLAEQSARSTEKINALVRDIQNEVNSVSIQMNNTVVIVEEQEKSVDETVRIFESIAESVYNVDKNITEVANDTEMLTTEASNVVALIENLAGISQESAAGTEEVSASTEENAAAIQKVAYAADELNKIVSDLMQSIARFRI